MSFNDQVGEREPGKYKNMRVKRGKECCVLGVQGRRVLGNGRVLEKSAKRDGLMSMDLGI